MAKNAHNFTMTLTEEERDELNRAAESMGFSTQRGRKAAIMCLVREYLDRLAHAA